MNDELLALADRLKNAGLNFGDQSDPCSLKVTVPERDTIVTALRLAAQSPEPFGWIADNDKWRGHVFYDRVEAEKRVSIFGGAVRAVYTAPPQSASDGALREALHLFREFVLNNVTQWKLGAGDANHPMWALVAVALDDTNKIGVTKEECWRFIQPLNREPLAASEATKSDGGALPTNLAEIIELELMAWRGANGGVYTIRAAALGVSCAIRSAVFRAINTSSDGGHGGQPYASTDAVEGASAPNAISGKQEGRTGHER